MKDVLLVLLELQPDRQAASAGLPGIPPGDRIIFASPMTPGWTRVTESANEVSIETASAMPPAPTRKPMALRHLMN